MCNAKDNKRSKIATHCYLNTVSEIGVDIIDIELKFKSRIRRIKVDKMFNDIR